MGWRVVTYQKDFVGWHNIKLTLNERKGATFKEREVWWSSIGVNVGHEEDGKHSQYFRPVLVLRKFNNHIFWGVPLTTQIKTNPYYFKMHFKEKDQCAMLAQMRLFDSKRLSDKMGQIPMSSFDDIRAAIKNML
jgi:mRNA-degrading endonuclease toxin of MazEF toxin-antitoxin module